MRDRSLTRVGRNLSTTTAPRLSTHIYGCRTADYVVLLDARKGVYLGVGGAAAQQLASRLDIRDANGGIAEESATLRDEGAATELIHELRERGMISESVNADEKTSVREALPAVEDQLLEYYEDPSMRFRLGNAVRFFQALVVALALMKFRSIEFIAARARQRRIRRTQSGGRFASTSGWDGTRACTEVAEFEMMYRLAFSSAERCLLKSIALQEYLSAKRIFPKLVIGVSTHPFRAHSWLQYEDIVVNDECYRVRIFTPILVS